MSLQDRKNKLIQTLSSIENWEDRYMKLIEMGKHLPEMKEEWKTEKNKVKGCQSQVWLHAELMPNGGVRLSGDSDALIVKGLVALVLEIFSEAMPSEIMTDDLSFLKEIGLDKHLSPSRSNGLNSMIKQIKLYALAFDYLSKNK